MLAGLKERIRKLGRKEPEKKTACLWCQVKNTSGTRMWSYMTLPCCEKCQKVTSRPKFNPWDTEAEFEAKSAFGVACDVFLSRGIYGVPAATVYGVPTHITSAEWSDGFRRIVEDWRAEMERRHPVLPVVPTPNPPGI